MRRNLLLVLVMGLATTVCLLAQDGKPLTNSDIVGMVKAGFEEPTILKAIQSSRCEFDVSVAALLQLKNASVSEKLIAAMLETKQPRPTNPAPPRNPLVPDDVGVYLLRGGRLEEMHVEIVTWRTGGVVKSMLIGTKGHINGVLQGPRSSLRLGSPLELVVRCPETVDIAEYQLLRMDEKKDRREFRALTGGFIHASGGSDKNAVRFRFEKIAPRTYKIMFDSIKAGEYGLLAPGGGQYGSIGGGASGAMVMQGSATTGKIYAFSILE